MNRLLIALKKCQGPVRLEVYDWDLLTKDDLIGGCEVDLSAAQSTPATFDLVDKSHA